MTTPTTNPVPSEAPQDLPFNAGNMDAFMQSVNPTFTDRFGVARPTLRALIQDMNSSAAETAAGQAAESALAAQVASTNAQSSSRTVASWTLLAALTPSAPGEGAEVLDADTGTHTDPLSSSTVANAGRYSAYATTTGAWHWIGPTGLSAKLNTSRFNQSIAFSERFDISWRDAVRRLYATITNAGLMRLRALSLGIIDRPEPPIEAGTVIVGRTALNRRHFSIGARTALNHVQARRFHGHDYAQFAPERQRRLVAGGCASPWYCSTIPGRSVNLRNVVQFPRPAWGLQLPFGNSFGTGETGQRLSNPGDPTFSLKPITLTASVEFAGQIIPLTFNGAASVVIKPNQLVWCDPIPIEVQGALPIRMFVVPDPTGFVPLGTPYFPGIDGGSYTASETDQTLNAGFTYPTWAPSFRDAFGNPEVVPVGYGPLVVTGFAVDPAVAVGFIGDSIPSGSADFYGTDGGFGFVNRAMRNRGDVVFTNLSQPGEQASQVLAPLGHRVRWQALAYVDHVVDELGVNDIAYGADLATLQGRCIQTWRQAAMRGCKVWRTTLTPVATSTDGFTTLANQTASGPWAPGGVRTQFNDWVRAGAPMIDGQPTTIGAFGARIAGDDGHPLVGYIELADAVESSRNSGKWGVTNGPLTTDGTHPNALGHQNMAEVLAAIPFF
ncbi:SGNH/GDSL hydrolase family protein [uncultured Pseudacidovorax sp.]|uniref:SGNH/GDSL hydrolase family protein n=1 Tax=uncultured Pseudacidovorax sp. TaxID=679313 RepID=UPI0025DE4404|nr:SGNH/GDSL hydrolase family protein [uncultured Pseudacidovorax sp.]